MARESRKAARSVRWRLWMGLLAIGLVFVSTAMAALKVRQYVIDEPLFLLSSERKDSLTVEGLKYTARSKVLRIFAGDFERSIYCVPLGERRRRLLGIDWVEDASISRVWPDRLVVRIRERKPVAFVYFHSGVMLIDSQGTLLDPPPQAQFTFPVLDGLREDEKDERRRERVRALLRVQQDMGYMAKDISEVNVTDLENIRLVAQVENRPVELIMGGSNFASRYRNFLGAYPEIRKGSPRVKIFDLRLDDRITAKE